MARESVQATPDKLISNPFDQSYRREPFCRLEIGLRLPCCLECGPERVVARPRIAVFPVLPFKPQCFELTMKITLDPWLCIARSDSIGFACCQKALQRVRGRHRKTHLHLLLRGVNLWSRRKTQQVLAKQSCGAAVQKNPGLSHRGVGKQPSGNSSSLPFAVETVRPGRYLFVQPLFPPSPMSFDQGEAKRPKCSA